MPTEPLEDLIRFFEQAADVLLDRFKAPEPSAPPYDQSCPPLHHDGRDFLGNQLQVTWDDFAQRLIATCVRGNQMSLGGTFIAPIPGSDTPATARILVQTTAKDVAKQLGDPYPVWHSAAHLSLIAERLLDGTLPSLKIILGSLSTLSELSRYRNYVFHPSASNRAKALAVAAERGRPGTVIGDLLASQGSNGILLFEDWVRELQTGARNAAQ